MKLIHQTLSVIFAGCCFLLAEGATKVHAATLVPGQSFWRFRKGTSEASSPIDAWRLTDFDDSGWVSAQAPFYYDNNGEITGNTELTDMRGGYYSIYLRKTFTVDNPAEIGSLSFGAINDDGYVAWINGKEIDRHNVFDGEVPYNQGTPDAIEPETTEILIVDPQDYLVAGKNVLAIHAVNRSLSGSSDFVIDAELVSHVAETEPPVISSVDPPADSQLGELDQITVTFSEPVNGVAADNLLINGDPAEAVSGADATYVFSFEQPAYGSVSVGWDPDTQIVDFAIPPNSFDPEGANASWSYELVDSIAPEAVQIIPAPGVTVRQLDQVQITFSEPVTGVDAGDLRVNGAPAQSVEGAAAGPYVFTVDSQPEGLATFEWVSNHGIRDAAASPNAFGGGEWSYTVDPSLPTTQVCINEFVASNRDEANGLRDEDGELQDWIELYNAGDEPVNLAGWSLTDDADDPGRWTLPSIQLGPDDYLVIFASEKNRADSRSGNWHTNFRLNPNGEFLGLFNAELPRMAVSEFQNEYPEQRSDFSYGLDSAGQWRYFSNPTPGAANGDSDIEGVLSPPHFNVARGYFVDPFELTLSSDDPEAAIRYTLNGGDPTSSTGQVFTTPLNIAETTIVRAIAVKEGFLPSRTETHSYLFLEQVLQQPPDPPGFPGTWGSDGAFPPFNRVPADYEMDPEIVNDPDYQSRMEDALTSLPVVSLAMDVDEMFGAANGIYTHTEPSLSQRSQWERPCSVEFILKDGSTGFHVDAGIRISGHASRTPRKNPKHSFRLFFKGDYGPSRLEYPVYPDSPAASFNTIVLRGGFNFSWRHWSPEQRHGGTLIRDGWTKDTWRAMGQPGSHSRYFHLYINGLYWGVYDFGERIDASFAANYLGGEHEDYDALSSKPTRAIDGDINAYNEMIDAINGRDMSNLANYTLAEQHLDMPTFIDYMLLNFYGANRDWGFDSNWNAIRPRAPGGTIKYIVWDAEQLVVGVNDNRVNNSDVPSGLHTSLLDSPEYRLAWADRVHKHLFNDGALTTDAVIRRWLDRASQVDLAVLAESARWGDYRRDVHQYSSGPYELYTYNDFWLPEVNRMVDDYFPRRRDIFLQQLRNAGLYPNLAAPVFNQHGGRVASGFNLTMSAGNTIYYTTDGSDPRVFGTGAISGSATAYTGPLSITDSMVVKARSRSGSEWSALNEAAFTVEALGTPLRITEIMYNPDGGNAYEFLELKNTGSAPLDVGGFSIDGIDYAFPPGTILQSGQVIVLGSDEVPANWRDRYPGVTAFGLFSGKLDNAGEKLVIRDANGKALWSVSYDNSNGWPMAADGSGYSIEIIDVFGDPNDPANWRAGAAPNGTPGTIPSPPASGAIVLNEIMADNLSAVKNGGFYPDWVELRNTGAMDADLSDWSLTDDDDPRKFVFPEGTTIPANGYLVVWCDSDFAAPGLHTSFALGRNGESVFLYDADGNRVDAVGFGLQLADYSIGRINGEWNLTDPTPNAANAAVALDSSSNLVINEWLADALPGEDDWIELYNQSANAPVSLRGIYPGTSESVFQLNALSFVPPGGYVQLLADEGVGANHLDFRLPAAGGEIVLYDETGLELDRVTYGSQTENVSQGRLPDGASTITSFPGSPSPGASNYLLDYIGPTLNEVLAINRGAVANDAGRTPDFVELRNDTRLPFDLSGMRLSNDRDNPEQWIFPEGTSIPNNGYLAVWFDNEMPATTEAGPLLNTGHSLDGEGGEVWLFNTAGQPVDSVVFGFQVPNLSIGKANGGEWRLLASPTPGAANSAPAALGSVAQLRINEWLANSPDGNDWFELYNLDDRPVELSGLYLTDDLSLPGRANTRIADLSFISAHGFVRWIADGDADQNPDQVNFRLDGAGDVIRLYDSNWQILDTVAFGASPAGVSAGRLPDGGDQIVWFPGSGTAGRSNEIAIILRIVSVDAAQLTLGFDAVAGKTYQVLYRDRLGDEGSWQILREIPADSDGPMETEVTIPQGEQARFFIIVAR